jgi:NitT/TauT family transport system substrate-binding protein
MKVASLRLAAGLRLTPGVQQLRRGILLLSVGCLLAAGCAQRTEPGGEIRLALGYIPNVQFAPYYVALKDGYFADAGLSVRLEYVADLEILKMISNGRFDFAATDGDSVILARLQGLPVRYVFTQYTQYPVGLITRREDGVRSLRDLQGKRIGIPEFFGSSFIGLKALLFAQRMSETDFQLQAIGFTQSSSLSEGKCEAVMGYLANEPIQLQAAGVAVDVIPVAAAGDLVGPGIVTSETFLSDDRDRAVRFVSAVRRGLRKTLDDPRHAFEVALGFMPDLQGEQNLKVQREVLAKAIELWAPGAQMGWCEESRWIQSQEVLFRSGMIGRRLPAADFFTNELIQAAGPEPRSP